VELGERIQNTKNLQIEGLQLRPETDVLFKALSDKLFENLDMLEMRFTTDEGNDLHESVDTIVAKLSHPVNLHTLKITLWENTYIGGLMQKLAEADLPLYNTVRNLEINIHNGINGGEQLAEFVGRFEQLDRLLAFPQQGVNPLAKITKAVPKLCFWTPDTQENCQIVSDFVNRFPPEELELEYIQFDEREYMFDRLPDLKRLKLQHLSNVKIDSLLSQSIEGLTHIHFNDIGMTEAQFDEFINNLDKCPNLEVLTIENALFDHEPKLITLAEKVAVNNKYSLREFNLGRNKIQKDTMDKILGNLKGFVCLEQIDLTCIKNIHEWKLEDLLDSLKHLEDESRDKFVKVNFSEHFFEYFCRDHKRSEALFKINEVCDPIRVYFHPMQTEEKPKDE
jgi:hypothetical protein